MLLLLAAGAFENGSVLCLNVQVLVYPNTQVNLVIILNLLTLIIIAVVNKVIQLQEEFPEVHQSNQHLVLLPLTLLVELFVILLQLHVILINKRPNKAVVILEHIV